MADGPASFSSVSTTRGQGIIRVVVVVVLFVVVLDYVFLVATFFCHSHFLEDTKLENRRRRRGVGSVLVFLVHAADTRKESFWRLLPLFILGTINIRRYIHL